MTTPVPMDAPRHAGAGGMTILFGVAILQGCCWWSGQDAQRPGFYQKPRSHKAHRRLADHGQFVQILLLRTGSLYTSVARNTEK